MADASIKIRGGAGNAVQIQSRAVDAVAPSDTEVLAWNATDAEWEPTASGGTSQWTDTGTVLHPTESTLDNVVVGGTTAGNSDIVLGVDGSAVFNEQGSDVDFRVESDTKDNAFIVQGSDGKVGIGITAPQKDLSVSGGGSDGTLQLTTTANGVSAVDGFQFACATSGAAVINQREAADLTVIVNGTTTMTYQDGGNVGVGTSSPDANFQVAQPTAGIGTVTITSTTTCTGTGTQFLNTFKVGDNIIITATAETRAISNIASDTVMTIAAATNVVSSAYTLAGGDRFSVYGNGTVSADGAFELKSQGSSASATADYSKFYALDNGPAADTDIKLLLHGDGTDESTSIVDSSQSENNPSVVGGTTQVDTAIKKWGTGSIMFDGDSDYLDFADDDDWTLDGEFAIHFWVYFTDNTEYSPIFSSVTNTSPNLFRLWWDGRSGHTNEWEVYDGDSLESAGASTVNQDTWYHMAITRDASNDVRLYQDGTQIHTYNSSKEYNAEGLRINKDYGTSTSYWGGHLDEFTWMKETDNGWNGLTITVPTGPTAGTSEMYVLDEVGNETKLSSHTPDGSWEYYSKSPDGTVTRINMEEVVRDLGQLTGKDYIKDK